MVKILDFFDSGTDRGKKLLRYPKRWEPTALINKLEKIGRAIAETPASATSIQRRPRFEEENRKLESSLEYKLNTKLRNSEQILCEKKTTW